MVKDESYEDRFDRAGREFAGLCRIMAKLRAPGGCPWDREQTLASLKPYLIEEAYETIDAIDGNDASSHCEELGDLMLQIVFQAEITQESGAFTVADVARTIAEKLVRRHPHVFADAQADNSGHALKNWEAIKATERPRDRGALDSIPRGLPALLRAMRMGEKAAAVGFDWNQVHEVVAKVQEEWREFQEALAEPSDTEAQIEELGDLLFAVVNLSRRLRIDAEAALQGASDKFKRRFDRIEARLQQQGRTARESTLAEMDALWNEAKEAERG